MSEAKLDYSRELHLSERWLTWMANDLVEGLRDTAEVRADVERGVAKALGAYLAYRGESFFEGEPKEILAWRCQQLDSRFGDLGGTAETAAASVASLVRTAIEAEGGIVAPWKNEAIVLVDETPSSQFSMKFELRKSLGPGYVFETEASPEDAFVLLEDLASERTPIGLLSTGWMFPKMKGPEFIGVLYSQHPKVPVILVTGFSDSSCQRLLTEGKIVAYQPEPWARVKFVHMVRHILVWGRA